MKNKRISIFLASCLISVSALAQTITKQEKGYFNLTEFSVFTGNNTFEYQTAPNSFEEGSNGAYALSLTNINGYFITNQISLGVGVGLGNYTNSENNFDWNNVFLLFVDARYYFKNKPNTFFAYGDIGSSIKIADNVAKGPMQN
ncbi:MAG: hypothetical protein EOO07_23825, partial [Chitinophagaceae bacterium]